MSCKYVLREVKLRRSFLIPAIYYAVRYHLPRRLPLRLVFLGAGIGLQGVLGWYMVKSGLDQNIIDTNGVPRVSQYRLAAHLSAAVVLYLGMLSTALSLRKDAIVGHMWNTGAAQQAALSRLDTVIQSVPVRRYKILVHLAASMVFFTAVSGAFVAGLDAGLVYNEFPTMGGRIMPPVDELMDPRYAQTSSDFWWRNMLENPVTAQFDHRLFVSASRSMAVDAT